VASVGAACRTVEAINRQAGGNLAAMARVGRFILPTPSGAAAGA
jgi:hypothetical protein